MEKYTDVFVHSEEVSPDAVRKSGSFTTLPVRIHKRNDAADAASRQMLSEWAEFLHDGQDRMSLTSISPLGNLCAFAYPEAPEPERLNIVTRMTDLGLLHDDATEGAEEDNAFEQHDDFKDSFNLQPSQQTTTSRNSRALGLKQLVAKLFLDSFAVDKERGEKMMDMYASEWVHVVEKRRDSDFSSLEEYLSYRSDNFGIRAFWPMVEFSMGWAPSESENASIKDLLEPIEEALMLTNDYWSWEREYEESVKLGNRLVNAVDVIRRVNELSIPDACEWVKNRIIACEQEYVRRKEDFYQQHRRVSVELVRWIEQAGCILSGSHYWASSAARHHAWKEHREDIAANSEITISLKDEKTIVDLAESSSQEDDDLTNRSSSDHLASTNTSVDEENSTSGVSEEPKIMDGTSSVFPATSDHVLRLPATYVMSLPSKGVRAMLIDAFNAWLDIDPTSMSALKALIDLLHNASLILDDIEDNSLLRRGKPATHTLFGISQSVNSANFMFVEAVQLAVKLRNPQAVPILLNSLEKIYIGQSWDLYYKYNMQCPTEDEYLSLVDGKTGQLFKLLLDLVRGESPETKKDVNFDRLLCLFGRFFQIRDDYMNLCSEDYQEKKGAFEDLDEGKFSYPIVHLLNRRPDDRDQVLGILRQTQNHSAPQQKLPLELKLHVVDLLRSSGTFDHTLAYLKQLEQELDQEIGKIEKELDHPNHLLRIIVARLSVRSL